MTSTEAKVALKLNAICETRNGMRGYICEIIVAHYKNETFYRKSVLLNDMREVPSVYREDMASARVISWGVPEVKALEMIRDEERRGRNDGNL